MFVAGVVGATLVVASKGFGFVENVEPKALVGLEGCMWVQLTGFGGCSVFVARSNSSFFSLMRGHSLVQ